MPAVDLETLNGPQTKAVVDAIVASFSPNEFEMLLAQALDKSLDNLAAPGVFPYRVFQVVQASQRKGFGARLIEALEAALPDAARIRGLRTTLALLEPTAPPSAPAGTSLERILKERSTIKDFGRWLELLAGIQGRVCRVEGRDYGTGFLVADDLVLTNYHVIEAVANGTASPDELAFRFDYSTKDGADRPGRVVKAAAQWLVASAPYSPADIDPAAGQPTGGQLDFALVRLAEAAGRDPSNGGTRGFIPLPSQGAGVGKGDVVFIVQHPRGAPLSMASGVVEDPVPSGLRLRYDADTEAGSSGSPVFDANLGLVCLHHAGDPGWTPTYNQGIPIGLIAAFLKNHDIALAAGG